MLTGSKVTTYEFSSTEWSFEFNDRGKTIVRSSKKLIVIQNVSKNTRTFHLYSHFCVIFQQDFFIN